MEHYFCVLIEMFLEGMLLCLGGLSEQVTLLYDV